MTKPFLKIVGRKLYFESDLINEKRNYYTQINKMRFCENVSASELISVIWVKN